MDTKVHWELPIKGKSVSPKDEKKVDEKFVAVKGIENVSKQLLPPFTSCASLGPITPDSNRESGDFSNDLKSPITLVKNSSPEKEQILCLHSHPTTTNGNSSPLTPVDGVFDPFAPGPEELLHAPRCMKFRGESQINIVRRLNFDFTPVDGSREESWEDDVEGSKSDEEMLLEIVYDNLLEAIIVSKQREGLVDDGCKTPDSAKRLSGVAETCPEAPLKCSRRMSRNIDRSFCRRLEF